MLVFVLNQIQKANTGKIQTPVYENVREFGDLARKVSRRNCVRESCEARLSPKTAAVE